MCGHDLHEVHGDTGEGEESFLKKPRPGRSLTCRTSRSGLGKALWQRKLPVTGLPCQQRAWQGNANSETIRPPPPQACTWSQDWDAPTAPNCATSDEAGRRPRPIHKGGLVVQILDEMPRRHPVPFDRPPRDQQALAPLQVVLLPLCALVLRDGQGRRGTASGDRLSQSAGVPLADLWEAQGARQRRGVPRLEARISLRPEVRPDNDAIDQAQSLATPV